MRLADIVAASSCFPGGFEPLAFPYDFAWPGGQVPPELKKQFTQDEKPYPVGVMDGGTYDNQGIGSILLADGRDEKENEAAVSDLGMFVISDVDRRSGDLYPFPPRGKPGGPTLGTVKWLLKKRLPRENPPLPPADWNEKKD